MYLPEIRVDWFRLRISGFARCSALCTSKIIDDNSNSLMKLQCFNKTVNYISSAISGKYCSFIGLHKCNWYRKLHGPSSINEKSHACLESLIL